MPPETPTIRTPIVCILGHVDHGKTTLLDTIRGSSVVATEEGAITQHIGATMVPIEAIRQMGGRLDEIAFDVPGLLFIDTPGHHAFTTLRARGGALADLAVVVIDANEGFQPQTIEALQILRSCRTPFVIAANKIDRFHGWRIQEGATFHEAIGAQNERIQRVLDEQIYRIVGDLTDLGFSSNRFDRVRDFSKNIGIVPVSAVTGEGIPDLLMVLIGLAQRYMTGTLAVTTEGPGAGTVLEVKEERGLGTTLDVILFDGTIRVGEEIAVAGHDGVITTKVRSLLKPRPLHEIMVEERFERVGEVTAASGVKVAAPHLDGVIAGTPLRVIRGDAEAVIAEVSAEMEDISVTLSEEGVVLKADTIGALEALSKEMENNDLKIVSAEVGPVTRHDIIAASTVQNSLWRAVLAFNTPVLPDAIDTLAEPAHEGVQLFQSAVIYQLVDDFLEWQEETRQRMEQKKYEHLVYPAKIRILPGCIFRQSNPAVVGVRVLAGTLMSGVDLVLTDGRKVGRIRQIQERQESIHEAGAGAEVAISIEGATVGRQIREEDECYVDVPERHVRVIETELIDRLSPDARDALADFTGLKRKSDPFWGR
ncbi:MAG: translation initiation factor IF-2 [Methanomicrobiales archaeon]